MTENCSRCGRSFTGLVDRNGASVIGRDYLASRRGELPAEQVRITCWQCSDAMQELSDEQLDAAIRAMPHPEGSMTLCDRPIVAASSLALGLILIGTVGAAYSQEPSCAPPDVMRAELKRAFGEEPVAIGLTTRGTLIEVTTTLDGATFTIIETTAAGVSCVKAAGKGWLVKTPVTMGDPT